MVSLQSLHTPMMLWCALLISLMSCATALAGAAQLGFLSKPAYPAMFVFGDSISDAGNTAIWSNSSTYRTLHYPFWKTFPGRHSDGHILVDFLAEYLGLPVLNAYLNSTADFSAGVNYAYGGATALDVSFYSSLDIYCETDFTLGAQVAAHLEYKARVEASNGSLAGSPAPIGFEEGLYVIEIGGVDYGRAYMKGYPPSIMKSTFIPLVIQKIHDVVEILIENGAKHFVFVSMTPFGCCPDTLGKFDGAKDSDGCLEEHNFASYLHGVHLLEEVAKLRATYINVSFLFVDYYGAYKHVLKQKEIFGFATHLDICCGAGSEFHYNYNPSEICNKNSTFICANPNKYMIWDGTHFTDAFNFQIFNHTFILGSYLDKNYSL